MSYTKEKVLLYHSGNYNCDLCLSGKTMYIFKNANNPNNINKRHDAEAYTQSHFFKDKM